MAVIVGIQIEETAVVVVWVKKRWRENGPRTVLATKQFPLEGSSWEKCLTQALNQIQPGMPVGISVPDSWVWVSLIESRETATITSLSNEEREAWVTWKFASTVGLKKENLIGRFQLSPSGEGELPSLLAVAMRKERVEMIEQICRKRGIDVAVIRPVSFHLLNLYREWMEKPASPALRARSPSEGTFLFLLVDQRDCSLLCCTNGFLRWMRVKSIGVEDPAEQIRMILEESLEWWQEVAPSSLVTRLYWIEKGVSAENMHQQIAAHLSFPIFLLRPEQSRHILPAANMADMRPVAGALAATFWDSK